MPPRAGGCGTSRSIACAARLVGTRDDAVPPERQKVLPGRTSRRLLGWSGDRLRRVAAGAGGSPSVRAGRYGGAFGLSETVSASISDRDGSPRRDGLAGGLRACGPASCADAGCPRDLCRCASRPSTSRTAPRRRVGVVSPAVRHALGAPTVDARQERRTPAAAGVLRSGRLPDRSAAALAQAKHPRGEEDRAQQAQRTRLGQRRRRRRCRVVSEHEAAVGHAGGARGNRQ